MSLAGDVVWVLEAEPLHSVGVRFAGDLLGSLVGDLVVLNTPVVARAPSNIDADAGSLARRAAMYDRVFLAWTWSSDVIPQMAVREDGDC